MRKDYEILGQKIKNAYIDYIKKTKQIPTQTRIAEICGTTQNTVSKHLSKIDLKDITQPFKVLGNDVLMGLAERAKKGDAQAAKLYFALVYDYSEKSEQKVEDNVHVIIERVKTKKDEKKISDN